MSQAESDAQRQEDAQRREDYVRLWRRVLVDLLGRDPAEVDGLVQEERRGLDDPNSWFYHEPAEYYVAPLLVPRHVLESLPSRVWWRLCWEIYPIIGRYQRECSLDASCFPQLRRDLDRTIADWVAVNLPKE